MHVEVFDTASQCVTCLSDELQRYSEMRQATHIALSGGSTPQHWFDFLAASPFRDVIEWQHLHFWWGDERFVPHDQEESNFYQANERLFKKVSIAAENLHPVDTGSTPEEACASFEKDLSKHLACVNELPQFDWVILGVGEDGHTASLFPGQELWSTAAKAIHVKHPQSGQSRISLSAPVLANARRLTYLVMGAGKQDIVRQILSEEGADLPAGQIRAGEGKTEIYLDSAAAALLANV